MSYDKIRRIWVGSVTRTSQFDDGSDPAHQWDTKRKRFSLAEVSTLPSAALLRSVLQSVTLWVIFHLSVCLCAGYLKKLWTDPDETWWTRWVCDKEELIQFWWRSESGSGYENYFVFKVILHHWERGPKAISSMIFQKCIGPNMFSWIRHYVAEVCALPSALLVISVYIC